MDLIFAPPFALLIYCALIGVLVIFGGWMTLPESHEQAHDSLYGSGEAPPDADDRSVPGYRPFFRVALFFAVLHLGVVLLATSPPSGVAALYLLGLMIVLATLIVA